MLIAALTGLAYTANGTDSLRGQVSWSRGGGGGGGGNLTPPIPRLMMDMVGYSVMASGSHLHVMGVLVKCHEYNPLQDTPVHKPITG